MPLLLPSLRLPFEMPDIDLRLSGAVASKGTCSTVVIVSLVVMRMWSRHFAELSLRLNFGLVDLAAPRGCRSVFLSFN